MVASGSGAVLAASPYLSRLSQLFSFQLVDVLIFWDARQKRETGHFCMDRPSWMGSRWYRLPLGWTVEIPIVTWEDDMTLQLARQ